MNKEELIEYLKNRNVSILSKKIILAIDDIKDDIVYYRKWRVGSDCTAEGDWNAFIGAFRMHYDDIKDYIIPVIAGLQESAQPTGNQSFCL